MPRKGRHSLKRRAVDVMLEQARRELAERLVRVLKAGIPELPPGHHCEVSDCLLCGRRLQAMADVLAVELAAKAR